MADHKHENQADFSINLEDSIYDSTIASPVEDTDTPTIVRSMTTDTLDSVALGPSQSEENLQRLGQELIVNVDSCEKQPDTPCHEEDNALLDSLNFTVQPTIDSDPSCNNRQAPSLQSYFTCAPVLDDFSQSFFDDFAKSDVGSCTSLPQVLSDTHTEVDYTDTSSACVESVSEEIEDHWPSLSLDRQTGSDDTRHEREDKNVEHENIEHEDIEHENIEHENIEHEDIEHENIGHENIEHENIGHENIEHENIGHEDIEHENIGHENIEHGNIGHGNIEHDDIEHENIEHEHHRQIRTVSETEVVDFCYVASDDKACLITSEQSEDILTNKEEFEHFTAEGGDEEGLDNLSVSPCLRLFITPGGRDSGEYSSPVSTASPVVGTAGFVGGQVSPTVSTACPVVSNVSPVIISNVLQSPVHSPPPYVSPSHSNTSIIPTGTLTHTTFSDMTVSHELDPFTASIEMSDKERQYDAWLPCEETKRALVSVMASLPGSFTVLQEHMCYPAIVTNDPQVDPVYELMEKHLGEEAASKRRVLTVDDVSQDQQGLSRLIEAGCYWAAIDLTSRLLTVAGQGVDRSMEKYSHTPNTLQLWLCRFNLHLQLHVYPAADAEMKAFLSMDSPDLYYEYYATIYPGRRGSMVPFSLRLIHAELPHYMGRTQEALDRLYFVLSVVRSILFNLKGGKAEDGSETYISCESRNESMKVWEGREIKTLYTIANTLLAIKDYNTSIGVYDELVDKDSVHSSFIHSGVGRIYLQMGNVTMAKESFDQAMVGKSGHAADVDAIVNKGLLCMCEAHYPDAWHCFSQAVSIDPLNLVAINNLSVCALYMGRLREALTCLENLVHQCPQKNLHAAILFNLCTLYELESSRAMSKKQALLTLVSQHKGDGFPVACLKMA